MKAIQAMLPGGQEESEADQVCGMCPSLTYQQRMIGFVGCFALGYLLSFIVRTYIIHLLCQGGQGPPTHLPFHARVPSMRMCPPTQASMFLPGELAL